MTQPVLTREQARQFDRIAIERFGIQSLVLMENAARGATDVLCESQGREPARAILACGPGNNGGDGLVMARHLHLRGWQPIVVLLADPQKISKDASANLRILSHTTVEIITPRELVRQPLQRIAAEADWLIDAILGTGATPPLRPPLDEIVRILNEAAARRMAIDIPTGLDCDATHDSVLVTGPVFQAELTVTFVARKPVMQTPAGKNSCGKIRILDIGAPPEVLDCLDL